MANAAKPTARHTRFKYNGVFLVVLLLSIIGFYITFYGGRFQSQTVNSIIWLSKEILLDEHSSLYFAFYLNDLTFKTQ